MSYSMTSKETNDEAMSRQRLAYSLNDMGRGKDGDVDVEYVHRNPTSLDDTVDGSEVVAFGISKGVVERRRRGYSL